MYASEIEQATKKLHPLNLYFNGCHHFDDIPESAFDNGYAFVNTLKKGEEKHCGHWFLIWKRGKETIIYDSLGFPPENLLQFKRVGKMTVSSSPTMPLNSKLCGPFCLYVAFHSRLNPDLNFRTLISAIFEEKLEENEEKVKVFCKQFEICI